MNTRVTEQNWQHHPWVESVASALCLQRSKTEMKLFLRDLLTLKELQALGERLEVAKLLSKGLSYREVAKQTGASTSTVTRVAKFMHDGAGGYKKHFNLQQSAEEPLLSGLEALKQRKQRTTTFVHNEGNTHGTALRKFL